MELMLQKPFDEITIRNLLDRAAVGRSTFYAHFRDKDDLFAKDVADFFENMASAVARYDADSERVAPVRELFAHVADMRQFREALVAAGKWRVVDEIGRDCMARGIEHRLAQLPRGQALASRARTAVSHALAGALFSLLEWWLASGDGATAEQMDALYHRMVWSGLKLPTNGSKHA